MQRELKRPQRSVNSRVVDMYQLRITECLGALKAVSAFERDGLRVRVSLRKFVSRDIP
jgi:hypothetical protein